MCVQNPLNHLHPNGSEVAVSDTSQVGVHHSVSQQREGGRLEHKVAGNLLVVDFVLQYLIEVYCISILALQKQKKSNIHFRILILFS